MSVCTINCSLCTKMNMTQQKWRQTLFRYFYNTLSTKKKRELYIMWLAPCQIKTGAIYFHYLHHNVNVILVMRSGTADTRSYIVPQNNLGVLPFKLHKSIKIFSVIICIIIIFCMYVYLVIDCPKQKGKYVASCLMHFFCRTLFPASQTWGAKGWKKENLSIFF